MENQMARKPQHFPSFLKVFFKDFANKLRVPPAFVKKLNGKLPSFPVLKTRYGRSWDVKIEKMGDQYYFNNGWLQFVDHHKLKHGDFLVFCLIDDSTFKVSIYDPSCCEKNLPIEIHHLKKNNPRSHYDGSKRAHSSMNNQQSIIKIESSDDNDDDEPKVCSSSKTEDPYFFTVLTKHMFKSNSMFVPMHFVRETRLATKRHVEVRDAEGKVWCIKLRKFSSNRIDLSHGITDLLRANKLKEGDICGFKCIRDKGNLIQVELLNKLPSADKQKKMKRGRPPFISYLTP